MTVTTPAISGAGLTAFYGQAPALRAVDVELGTDEIVAVLGHNGAGKSTLLNALARSHRNITGQVRLSGQDITAQRPSAVAKLGVSLVRENAPVFGNLTIEENLKLGARLAVSRGLAPPAFGEVWTWFPALLDRRRAKAAVLSGGQRQMLSISTALMSRPRILLLDEPSAGLAPSMAEAVFVAIKELCATGMSVILAEQDMQWVTGFATRTYHLDTGRVVGSEVLRPAGVPSSRRSP
jgi:branched-chain amino acid transport system ATP-binding protein